MPNACDAFLSKNGTFIQSLRITKDKRSDRINEQMVNRNVL